MLAVPPAHFLPKLAIEGRQIVKHFNHFEEVYLGWCPVDPPRFPHEMSLLQSRFAFRHCTFTDEAGGGAKAQPDCICLPRVDNRPRAIKVLAIYMYNV